MATFMEVSGEIASWLVLFASYAHAGETQQTRHVMMSDGQHQQLLQQPCLTCNPGR